MGCQPNEIPHLRRFSDGILDNGLILRTLQLVHGQNVMDAGCGNGYMSMLFAEAVGISGHVYALDLSLNTFTTTFPEPWPANLSGIECDMTERIPLEEGSVDTVFTSTVVHSIPRDKVGGLVREFERVIRPGGTLAIVEMAKRETEFGPPVWQRYSPSELQKVFPFQPMGTLEVAEHFYMQLFKVL